MQEGLLTYMFANFQWRNKARPESGKKDKKGKIKTTKKEKKWRGMSGMKVLRKSMTQ